MSRRLFFILLVLLVVLNGAVWYAIIHTERGMLTVSFLDVGQGDAILIESPTGNQMLIDGGRDRSVLRELPKRMSPFDRSLDIVVETHPDADHIGGLPSVFDRYQVSAFLSPNIPNETNAAEALAASVANEQGMQSLTARIGQRIDLGGGVYADILFPDRDVSSFETNTGSIVIRIVYGETSFMLTGDSPSEIEDYLVSRYGTGLDVDVLKAGHHGSKNSTDDLWLRTLTPAIVVISAGKDNPYDHPAPETLTRITNAGAEVLSTLGKGAVVLRSDGETIRE